MPWLDALLALAVTMMVLSTLVSVLAEDLSQDGARDFVAEHPAEAADSPDEDAAHGNSGDSANDDSWKPAKDEQGVADCNPQTPWAKFQSWLRNRPGEFVKWFFSVFAAGILVGLGGPFWFDTFRKLAVLTSVARVFQSEVMQQDQKAREIDSKTEADSDKRADRFIRIFNTARTASDFARATGRQLLASDGAAIQPGHVR